MTRAKFLDNVVYLTVLKVNTVMLMCIEKKFASISAKNIVHCVQYKKENVKIVRTYRLNILLIVIICLLNYSFS